MSAITDSVQTVHKLWVPLLTASVVILLAAAVAIPNLLRSRMAADESRRLHSLDHMYACARPENPDARKFPCDPRSPCKTRNASGVQAKRGNKS